MENFTTEVQVRWADIDPNFHLRHSVYYDWGALSRVEFLNKYGLTLEVMKEMQIGPILLREECVFKKEIKLNENVTINLELLKSKRDYSRWTIQHTILKNENIVSAILTVDGAWIDTVKRKLSVPPQQAAHVFQQMPVRDNFQWLD
jgi:acyl-CoA thioester hydrolase